MPRAPLLRRLPTWVWTVPTWCGAILLALLMLGVAGTAVRPAGVGITTESIGSMSPQLQLVLSVTMTVPIIFVRRWPVPALALILMESAAYAAARGKTWPLAAAAIGLICYIAASCERRVSITVAAIAPLVLLAEYIFSDYGDNTYFSDYLSGAAGLAVLFLLAWMIGNSIRQSRAYDAALRAHVSGRAIMAERLRIARELHDQVAHSIGVIALQSGAARRAIDVEPAGAREALGVIEETSRETLAELRRMLGALRESEPASSTASSYSDRAPGLSDIDQLVARTAAAGVRVAVQWRGERRPLPPEIDLSAFRIIQESVTNVVSHAGTDQCQVNVEFQPDQLSIEIIDNGQGTVTHPVGTGYGIPGMRERVDLLHGQFTAGPSPEGGFRVAAQLPLHVSPLR